MKFIERTERKEKKINASLFSENLLESSRGSNSNLSPIPCESFDNFASSFKFLILPGNGGEQVESFGRLNDLNRKLDETSRVYGSTCSPISPKTLGTS